MENGAVGDLEQGLSTRDQSVLLPLDNAQFGLRVRLRITWFQSSEHAEPGIVRVLLKPVISKVDLRLHGVRDPEPALHPDRRPEANDANHGVGMLVDVDGLPGDERIGVVPRSPQGFANHNHRR